MVTTLLTLQRLFSRASLFWGGGGHARGAGGLFRRQKRGFPEKISGDREGDVPFLRGVSKKNSRKTDRRESKRRNSPVVPLRTGQSGTGGAVDRGDQVGSAGVQQESLSREVGHGSFSMGSGRDLVSPEVIDDEGDRVFLVEGRGEKSGGRELLGEGKRDVFFYPPAFDGRS